MEQATLDNKTYISFDDQHFMECDRLLDARDNEMGTREGLSKVWLKSMGMLRSEEKSTIPNRSITERLSLASQGAQFMKPL